MHAPDHFTVEEAFRWGQVRGLGGEPALVDAVNSTRLVRAFDHEAYWVKVIAFSVHFAEMVIGHIGPIVEYLRFQKHFYKLEPPLPEKRKAVIRLLEVARKVATADQGDQRDARCPMGQHGDQGPRIRRGATLESPDLDDPGIAR